MQALTLPARRGWRWLTEGFRIFRKKPVLLSFLVSAYWVLMLVVSSVPFAGQVVATLLIPMFSVSLMNACRLIEQEGTLPPLLLFSGFDRNPRVLLLLGVIYLACTLGILGATVLVDDGVLFHLLVLGQMPDAQAQASNEFRIAVQLALALFVPLVMANWYAPVLVAWHDLPVGKSLFFSFIACLRNWRVFLAYAATTFVFGAFLPGLALGLMGAMFADAGEEFVVVLTFFSVLILLPTLYSSFYVSYRDVFVIIDEDA